VTVFFFASVHYLNRIFIEIIHFYMINIYTTACFVLLSFINFAQHSITWEPEIIVSDGSLFGNIRPRMTILENGNPVILYGKTEAENLHVSVWNGTTFNAPIQIVPSGMSAYVANWTGPDIESKGDTIIAVFKLNPLETGNVYSVRSTDGGVTFSDTIRVDNHDNGVAWMPSMDLDDDGNPVITYMAHGASWSDPEYVLVNSDDAGLTYNPEFSVSNVAGEACDCCPAEVVVEGQKQVLLFRNNDANIRDIYAVLSNDGGATFPYEQNVDSLDWFITSCPSTGPDGIFMNDKLYAVSMSKGGVGYSRIYVSSSSVADSILLETKMVIPEPDPVYAIQNFPRISGENDTIVMTWQENVGNNTEIFYSVSATGGDHLNNLTTSKYIANDSTGGVQAVPDIRYKNGFVHLTFQDVITGNTIYKRGQIQSTAYLPEQLESIEFGPNPSQTGLFVFSKELKIQSLVNELGQSVAYTQSAIGPEAHVQLNENLNGNYFLTYRTNQNTLSTLKLVVIK